MAKEAKRQKQPTKQPAAGQRGAKKVKGTAQLPVLLEVSFTVSVLIVTLVGIITAAVSFLAGSPVWSVALRSGAAILVVGLVCWLITYNLTRGSIQANHAMRQELFDAYGNEAIQSTVERSA